jgi:hypothetical protein
MKRERNHALVSHASDGMHAHRHLHSLFFAISIHDDVHDDDDENRSIAGEVNGRTRKKVQHDADDDEIPGLASRVE